MLLLTIFASSSQKKTSFFQKNHFLKKKVFSKNVLRYMLLLTILTSKTRFSLYLTFGQKLLFWKSAQQRRCFQLFCEFDFGFFSTKKSLLLWLKLKKCKNMAKMVTIHIQNSTLDFLSILTILTNQKRKKSKSDFSRKWLIFG